MFTSALPSLIVGGGLINRGVGSTPDIGNLWSGNELKWLDIYETSLNWVRDI